MFLSLMINEYICGDGIDDIVITKLSEKWKIRFTTGNIP